MIRSILPNTIKNINKKTKFFITSTLAISTKKSQSLTHKIKYQVLQNAKRLQTFSVPQ